MSNSISLPKIPWQTVNLNNQIERIKNSVDPQRTSAVKRDDPNLKKACAEFESLFMFYLLKEMRATVPKSGFINGGGAEEIYTSMLDTQLARELSLNGGFGLSAILFNRLNASQTQVKARNLTSEVND
ncbi:MAG: rod-binding protein [Desulfatiglandaceae bacterium]|jgi:flagellar protein FlgJ